MSAKNVRLAMLWLIPFGALALATAYWLWGLSAGCVFVGYLWILPVVFSLTVVNLAGRSRLWVWSERAPRPAIPINWKGGARGQGNRLNLLAGRLGLGPGWKFRCHGRFPRAGTWGGRDGA
jgi:hypothetical protein